MKKNLYANRLIHFSLRIVRAIFFRLRLFPFFFAYEASVRSKYQKEKVVEKIVFD